MPKQLTRWGATVAGAVLVTVAASCRPVQQQGGAQPTAVDTAALGRLSDSVMTMIGDPTCANVAQCRTTAFGSKPCGGPWRYLVYSTAVTDSVKLAALVGRYNEMEAQINQREGRMSDCRMVLPPKLERVTGRCVAVP